jgi:tetratricopeptide (TPR) repeat protein
MDIELPSTEPEAEDDVAKINLTKKAEKITLKTHLASLAKKIKIQLNTTGYNLIRIDRRFAAIMRILLNTSILFVSIFFIKIIYTELKSKDFLIGTFEVPEEFARNGYSGTVLVHKMSLKIADMKKTTRSSYSENNKFKNNEATAGIDIEVAKGISLKSVIEQLRQTLGIERNYISGYLTMHDKKIQLTVNISNRNAEVFEQKVDSISQYDALEVLLQQASELILQNTDPIVMLNYYFQTKKQGKNVELAKYLLVNEPKYTAWAYLSWASGLRLENDNEGAMEMLKRAVEADSTLSDAWNSWGSILRNQKKYDEAIAKYEKAIACNPEYLLPYNNLAFVHFLKGEYDIAIQKANEIIARNEEFGYPYSILAQCYAKKGNEELFYKNTEIALKYKVPVWTWLKSDPWNLYVGQERFDKLIAKYRLD